MRRRRLLLLVLVLGLVGAGVGGWALLRHRKAWGALEVLPDPIDFGDVPWLERREKTVTIRNRSDHRVLIVTTPTFNCSCFSLGKPLATFALEPGATVDLLLLMATELGTAGPFHKNMSVRSDDPEVPELKVPVIGRITDFRSIDPRQLALGVVPVAGPAVERVIEVRGGHGYRVKVTAARASDSRLETSLKDAPDGTDVVVRTAVGAAAGRIGAQVQLTLEVAGDSGAPRTHTETVWVTGEIR